jgi:hypothetical protein
VKSRIISRLIFFASSSATFPKKKEKKKKEKNGKRKWRAGIPSSASQTLGPVHTNRQPRSLTGVLPPRLTNNLHTVSVTAQKCSCVRQGELEAFTKRFVTWPNNGRALGTAIPHTTAPGATFVATSVAVRITT